MPTIGVILLVILCSWTGWATTSLFYWRKLAKEWEGVAKDAKKLADDVIETNRRLVSDLERVVGGKQC